MSNSEPYPYPDERTQGQGTGRLAGAPYGAEQPATGQGYLSDEERAASIVAFSASRLVCPAMFEISPTMSPIRAEVVRRAWTSWPV